MSLFYKICFTVGMLLLVAECVWLLSIVIRQKLWIEWLESELKHSDEWARKLMNGKKWEDPVDWTLRPTWEDPADWWKDE